MKGAEERTRTTFLLFTAAVVAIVVSQALIFAQEPASLGQPSPKMGSAHVWLNKGLDAKKAKQGDAVTAKLLDDTNIPNSRDLPKNTILLGRIDMVQPSQNKGDSAIQVTFDKVQLPDGQQLTVKITMMHIYPRPGFGVQGGGSVPWDQMGSATGAAAVRNAGAAAPPAGSPTTQGGQADEGVNGVLIKSDVHQSDSGTFVSRGRNVSIGGGTEMQMAIIVLPPTPDAK
jgi:hypothetical protein